MTTTDQVARAICAEQCAYMGESPCYAVFDDQGKPTPWPNPNCDEPGCQALALAAVAAMGNRSEPNVWLEGGRDLERGQD